MTIRTKVTKKELSEEEYQKRVEAANADPTISPWYVSVLYADFGKRKTTTAVSMVKEKGLLLSSDDSWKVLRGNRFKTLLDKVRITKIEGLQALEYINLEYDDRDGIPYDTVIWDTYSKSVDRYLDKLSAVSDWGGKYREKLNTTDPELVDVESLAPADYRVTRDYVRPFLDRLLNTTQAHIIFTSQMTTPIPGMGPNQQKRPSVPEATFKIIGERADLITQLIPGVAGKFYADSSENSTAMLGKSRIETIQGMMDLNAYIKAYKEFVF